MPTPLSELLSQPDVNLLDVGGLLAFLAAVVQEPSPKLRAEAAALATRKMSAPTVTALARRVAAFLDQVCELDPGEEPDPQEIRGWLGEVAQIAQAARGCALLDPGGRYSEIADAVQVRLLQRQPAIARLAAAGWRIPAALSDRVPSSTDPPPPSWEPPERWFEALAEDILTEERATDLRRRISASGSLNAPYRAWLAARAEAVDVVRTNPAWSLNVLEEGTEGVPPIWAFPLPHLGADALLKIHLHVHGTVWHLPGQAPVLVAAGSPSHTWGDAATGPITTTLREYTPTPRHDRWQAVLAARVLAEDPGHPRATTVALAIARDLSEGELARQIEAAASALDEGVENKELEDWAYYGLELRVQLQRLADALDSPALFDALDRVDEALENYGVALLLVLPERRAELFALLEPDLTAWWGYPLALDRAVPEELAASALADRAPWALLAKAATSPCGHTIEEESEPGQNSRVDLARRGYAWLLAALRQPVFAGAQASLAAAATLDPQQLPAGCTPLLVLLPGQHSGAVLGLRIRYHEQGEPEPGPRSRLRHDAQRALRQAYEVAASLMPDGWPGAAFEVHRVDLVVPEGEMFEVDQDSLALPATLAFASLWRRCPLPAGLAATGALGGAAGREVVKVAGVPEKARALADLLAPEGLSGRLLAAPDNALEVDEPGITPVPVLDVEQAVGHAGIPRTREGYNPEIGSVKQGEKRLQALIDDVRTQNCEPYASVAGIPAWAVLGDQLGHVIRLLEGRTRETSLLAEGRGMAAEAYSHAGEMENSASVLGEEPPDATASPRVQIIWRIQQLNRWIDSSTWDRCHVLAAELTDLLEAVSPDIVREQAGFALGTMGRALVYEPGRTADGLPLLERAVAHHLEHQKVESGRTRIYVALALRLLGRYADASRQLDQARAEIQRDTRDWDPAYCRSTLMYWGYEAARLAVESGEPARALELLDPAMPLARATWPWPLVGILRTRAWALGCLEREAERRATIAELEATLAMVRERNPADGGLTFFEIVLAEAKGPPIKNGVID